MPDILIRGMEMPPSCADCPIKGDSDCKLTRQKVKYYHEDRRDGCPLVELPPHGDLIDRREIISDLDTAKQHPDFNGWDSYADGFARAFIETATVIVPAEKGE